MTRVSANQLNQAVDRAVQKAQSTLAQEAAELTKMAQRLDTRALSAALRLLLETDGKVVTTGVGKSGLVARKAASTMTSTGTLAIYLHPSEALHGDLGLLQRGDVVIAFGKSGESAEIMAIVPAVKSAGAKIIAITAAGDSFLARESDVALVTRIDSEACPFDLTPTTSSLAAMAAADALAMGLMVAKDFQPTDFANFHPGGKLGRRLLLKVRDVMLPLKDHAPLDPATARIEDVITALGQVGLVLFSSDRVTLDGILTDGDVRRLLEKQREKIFSLKVGDVMNRMPSLIEASVVVSQALTYMEGRDRPLNAAPVVDTINGIAKIVGVVRLHDLVRV